MKIKHFVFEFFFLDFQLNSSTQFFLNSKCVVQKNSTNVCQVIWNCRPTLKKKHFPTLNAIIFQSVRANFMKCLPHDLRQVKYKILRLDSKKIYFSLLWVNTAELAILSGFWQKNDLGHLGVKHSARARIFNFFFNCHRLFQQQKNTLKKCYFQPSLLNFLSNCKIWFRDGGSNSFLLRL